MYIILTNISGKCFAHFELMQTSMSEFPRSILIEFEFLAIFEIHAQYVKFIYSSFKQYIFNSCFENNSNYIHDFVLIFIYSISVMIYKILVIYFTIIIIYIYI